MVICVWGHVQAAVTKVFYGGSSQRLWLLSITNPPSTFPQQGRPFYVTDRRELVVSRKATGKRKGRGHVEVRTSSSNTRMSLGGAMGRRRGGLRLTHCLRVWYQDGVAGHV